MFLPSSSSLVASSSLNKTNESYNAIYKYTTVNLAKLGCGN